jgi:6-phosphogluconolactonase
VSNVPGTEGLVTGLAVGNTSITATLNGIHGSTTVTVTAATLTSITVDPLSPSIVAGTSVGLTATGTFSDGTFENLTTSASWISSDPAVATVISTGSQGGMVTGIAAGTSTVQATQDGVSGSAAVTVTAQEFAYVTSETPDTVTAFAVDSSTGALTQLGPPSVLVSGNPASLTADPSGRFLYVTIPGLISGTVAAFTITQSGPGTGGLNLFDTFGAGAGAFGIAVEPSGHFAYVGNTSDNSVSGYAITQSGGTASSLTQVPGSPFSALPATGSKGVAAHPNGLFIYVAESGTNQVSRNTLNSTTGELNLGTQFLSPASVRDPVSVTLDPTGRFAYTANNLPPVPPGDFPNGSVSVYTVAFGTGALTFVENVPVGTSAGGPTMVAIDPSGRFAYVAGGGEVAAFIIDQITGALTPTTGSPFAAGLDSRWVTVNPDGKFVYVTNHGSGTTPGGVSEFAINPDGSLTPLPGITFPTSGPTSMTMAAVP